MNKIHIPGQGNQNGQARHNAGLNAEQLQAFVNASTVTEMIRPTRHHILVERISDRPADSKIVLLEGTEDNHAEKAVVVAVGPGQRSILTGKHIPLDYKVGDRVAFVYGAGRPVLLKTVEGKTRKFWLMEDSQIQGVYLNEGEKVGDWKPDSSVDGE